MPPIKISEKTKDRWALVNEADRQTMMLEFQYQTLQTVKSIRSVAYFFFVVALLGLVVGLIF